MISATHRFRGVRLGNIPIADSNPLRSMMLSLGPIAADFQTGNAWGSQPFSQPFAQSSASPVVTETPSVMTIDAQSSVVSETVGSMAAEAQTQVQESGAAATEAVGAQAQSEGHITALSPEAARPSSLGSWLLLGAAALAIAGSVYVLRR